MNAGVPIAAAVITANISRSTIIRVVGAWA
jgi:hypothetical protein